MKKEKYLKMTMLSLLSVGILNIPLTLEAACPPGWPPHLFYMCQGLTAENEGKVQELPLVFYTQPQFSIVMPSAEQGWRPLQQGESLEDQRPIYEGTIHVYQCGICINTWQCFQKPDCQITLTEESQK